MKKQFKNATKWVRQSKCKPLQQLNGTQDMGKTAVLWYRWT